MNWRPRASLEPVCPLRSIHTRRLDLEERTLADNVKTYIPDRRGPLSTLYQLVAPRTFKQTIFDWLENVKSRAVSGDRLIPVFCAHGLTGSCKVVLSTQSWFEYLSKAELGTSLAGLAADMGVLIVNEACYSGSWTTLSPDLHGKEVLVEAASPKGGLLYNYRSASSITRCSLFGAAFVQELTVSPEGRAREHTTRIASEVSHVETGQPTGAPTFSAGPRSPWSFNYPTSS